MNKYVKGVLIFTGGAVVGTVVGGISVISVAVRIDSIRKAITKEIARRLCNSIYGAPKGTHERYYEKYFDRPIYVSRSDAHEILDKLNGIILTYGYATVADLYDLSDLPCDYTYNKYGWTNLRDAKVVRVRDEYTIDLPMAEAID